MIKIVHLLIFLALTCSSCSLASYVSQEALSTAAGGGLIGGAAGYAISRRVGNASQNILVNSAIGTAAGLAVGSFLNQKNIQTAKKREVVVREAKLIGKNQLEVDKLRKEVYDSSSWGNNEVSSWDQRYPTTNNGMPHQGSSNYQSAY